MARGAYEDPFTSIAAGRVSVPWVSSFAAATASDPTASSDFALPSFARTITWNVAKSVDSTRQDVPAGSSATFNYTVTVTHDDGVDSNWQVIGSITVYNDNDAPVDGVTVSEAIDDPNATCVVSGASSTIPPVNFLGAGHTTFPYSCSYSAAPENVSETSTATISWPAQTLSDSDSLAAGSTTAEAALDWSDPDDAFYLDGSVDVSDSLAGDLGFLSYTDPDSTSFTYPFTFDGAPAGTCISYPNTASLTNLDAGELASDSATVEVCAEGGSDLTVTKTATPSFTRTFGWTVTKSVDQTSQKIAAGGSAKFDYAVDVSKDTGVDSGWAVTGTITVGNPNGEDVDASLADTAPGGTCSLDQTSVTVPANGSITVGYVCTFASGAPGTNTATATWDSAAYSTPDGSASGTADYAFDTPTTLVDDSVGVYDNGSLLGTTNASTEFTYSKSFPGIGGTCTPYDNTATVQNDTAVLATSNTVIVQVCANEDLTVSKTASPSFTRTYKWKIAKSVAAPTTVTSAAGAATFNYTVNVTGNGYTDSGWLVTGTITVSNPNDWDAITANVIDAVNNGGVCTVANGTGVSVPADGSVTLGYSCAYASAPSPSAGVNTATATWDTSAFPAPDGSATGTAGFTFGAPTTELTKTVTVTDTFNGSTKPLGSVAYPGPGTFAYPRTVNVPATGCVTYPNTASLVETGQTASASVTVCKAACPGEKINFRWHYSANGSSGSWSGTSSTTCDGSTLRMGPQAMEGDLKLTPGTTLHAGYDFTLPGNNTTRTFTVTNPQVVFTVHCVSGATPSQGTLTVPMATTVFTVGDSAWYPSGDQSSALVSQGSVAVPAFCGTGQVRLDAGGTFTTTVT